MRRVAILHPWLPAYRVAFFERLLLSARAADINLQIYTGGVRAEWKHRGDDSMSAAVTPLATREITVRGRRLAYKSIGPLRPFSQWDLVICEQALSNLETYALMALMPGRVALWGHGGAYTFREATGERRVRGALTKRARWFYAYTDGGAAAVESMGFDRSRVTVVNNTFDTDEFDNALSEITVADVALFRSQLGVPSRSHLVCLVGAVDRSKRADFVVEAVSRVRRNLDVHLVVAGDGPGRPELEAVARECGWIHVIGRAEALRKALLLRSASLILNPGRVGLIAVDSARSGTPIVTTDWPYHAPEIEYLTRGSAIAMTEDSPEAFADEVCRLLRNEKARRALRDKALAAGTELTIDNMVDRFLGGLNSALQDAH